MPSIFGYWTLRGLGQAPRFMLEYAGEDYKDERWETSNREAWLKFKEANPHNLPFPNLPYYVDGKVRLTQSIAILRYLGRKHNMAGNSESETQQLDMLESVLFDLRLWLALLCYGTEETFKAQLKDTLEKGTNCCKQLNTHLGSKKWFLGDRISYVDFLVYDILTNWLDLEKTLLDDCANLRRLRQQFESLPAIKKYMQSDRFIKWPMNGPSAYFGGK